MAKSQAAKYLKLWLDHRIDIHHSLVDSNKEFPIPLMALYMAQHKYSSNYDVWKHLDSIPNNYLNIKMGGLFEITQNDEIKLIHLTFIYHFLRETDQSKRILLYDKSTKQDRIYKLLVAYQALLHRILLSPNPNTTLGTSFNIYYFLQAILKSNLSHTQEMHLLSRTQYLYEEVSRPNWFKFHDKFEYLGRLIVAGLQLDLEVKESKGRQDGLSLWDLVKGLMHEAAKVTPGLDSNQKVLGVDRGLVSSPFAAVLGIVFEGTELSGMKEICVKLLGLGKDLNGRVILPIHPRILERTEEEELDMFF
ncbi:hypothetical protein QBC38DRAFT_449070 [Podospora fimiseda]|uniref:Uncharacterized protein n=1 Tax=Podospora fimiseda TaxID=252190 RepID=A0AAN6YLY5_9PEZI|nr:hypothetical protein QBC38DRAFT_449070 [Podospora fimiseda]